MFLEPEEVPANKIIGADLLPIEDVVGGISHVHFGESAYGTFIELKQGQDLNQTKMLFTGYDFSKRLEVTHSLVDEKIFPSNILRSPSGAIKNRGMFVNFKKTVFYVLLSDESSGFDKVFQNKIVKLRVYYTTIFLAKLSMTLVAELDLSTLVNIAKLEILDIKSLGDEKSILLELSPARDQNGNIIRSVKFIEDMKADMLQKLGVKLDDLSTKNKLLKIDLLELILPRI